MLGGTPPPGAAAPAAGARTAEQSPRGLVEGLFLLGVWGDKGIYMGILYSNSLRGGYIGDYIGFRACGGKGMQYVGIL